MACDPDRPVIATARIAADLLAPLFADARGERLAIAHLDEERTLLNLVHRDGAAEDIALPVSDILREAMLGGAIGLIVAHNHPSGDPRPSEADKVATRHLAGAAAQLGIRLHDHLIFAAGQCRSFRALGLL